jgi:hypothetical protein
MVGVARAQDIMSATLGDLYRSVAQKDGAITTLWYGLEPVLTMDLLTMCLLAMDLLPTYADLVERERFAFAQDDLDTLALG